MLRERVRAEHQPGLLAMENAMNERLDAGLQRRKRLAEGVHQEMLHAEDFVDDQPGEDLLVVHHQHPALLAQGRQLGVEEAAQVHDRQQASAHVGDALDPALHARQQGVARLVQHFADLAHGRHEQALAHAEADAAPALHHLLLRRQASRQRTTALVDLEEELEGSLRIRHGDRPWPTSDF
ncbi:hypothetical protein D9M69_559030 [compost metagenome]